MGPVTRQRIDLPIALALSVLSGVLLWVSSPQVGVGWLAWFAIVPAAIVALRTPGTRLGRLALPLAFFVYMELLLLIRAFPFGIAEDQYGETPVPILVNDSPVLAIALIIVPIAVLVLYAIGFPYFWPLQRTHGRPALALVVVPALAWTAFDVLRTKFGPGGFWGPLFLSQHDTAASSVSTLVGPWLLSFVIALAGFALAYAIVRRRQAVRLVAGVAVFGVTTVVAIVAANEVTDTRGAPVRVAAIQPGYDTAEFDLPLLKYMRRATRDHERVSLDLIGDLAPLTRTASAEGADLVVWPEAVVWVDPRQNVAVSAALRSLARQTGATIVVPYFLRERDHGAAVVVTAQGEISLPFPKQRPMWFLGEKGDNRVPPATTSTSVGRLGTMLGVDNQDPRSPRALTGEAAALISSSTHDWKQLAPQQLAMSELHAAALQIPIVRADWRYGSAIIDSGGERLADAGADKHRTVLVADVSPRLDSTPYARVGDTFGWAAVALAGAIWLMARGQTIRRSSSRRSASVPSVSSSSTSA